MTVAAGGTQQRAARVRQLMVGIRSYLFDQINRAQLDSGEHRGAYRLMIDAGRIEKSLRSAGEDATRQIERDRVRPLVWEVRRYALRDHLTLARPYWGWQPLQVDPNAVCVVGSGPGVSLVERLAHSRGLRLVRAGGWGAAQSRWNQVRECPLAVFDLGPEGNDASSCHALGFALALGVYPIVTLPTGIKPPFDIDIPPIETDGSRADEGRLEAALDEALFALHPTAGVGNSVMGTVRKVDDLVSNAGGRTLLRSLLDTADADPIQASDLLGHALNAEGCQEEFALFCGTWPGAYPDPSEPRCFHVMPFSRDWSDKARDTVRLACEAEHIRYRRGDETEEQRIVRSIWQEIGRAEDVVVDITGLNSNVCLELGVAQALGRRTLLLTRDDGTIEKLYPEIAKDQVRIYAEETLSGIVREFLPNQPR